MRINEIIKVSDPVLDLITRAVKHFGRNELYGGNCGQFALALAKHLSKQGIHMPLVVICDDVFDSDMDVTPENILQADAPVYHVALEDIMHANSYYDADGKVTGDHIQQWIQKQYRDQSPAVFAFELQEPGLEALIRTETDWSIPAQVFEEFFQQLKEGAYQGGLRKWFKQSWKDISRSVDGKHPPCGASAGTQGRGKDPQRAYPKCVPAQKAGSMTAKQKRSATQRKRKVERKPGAAGRVDHVKTEQQLSEAQPQPYRNTWRGSTAHYDPDYFDVETETLDDEHGAPIAEKDRLIPKSNLKFRLDLQPQPGVIYRGMSAHEYENILRTGQIQSKGGHNIGDEQKGLTYYSTDPDTAESYASSFAPDQYRPTWQAPAYVVAVKTPSADRIKKVPGTGEHEVGVQGAISADDIVSVYQGKVVALTPAINDRGFSSASSAWLHWKKIH